jgi:hypothetical protein
LVGALRTAARMDPDEPLPGGSLWFVGLVREAGVRAGLEPLPPGALADLLLASA